MGAYGVNRHSHGNECVSTTMPETVVRNGHDDGGGGCGQSGEEGEEGGGRGERRKYSLRETEKRLKRELRTKGGSAEGTLELTGHPL